MRLLLGSDSTLPSPSQRRFPGPLAVSCGRGKLSLKLPSGCHESRHRAFVREHGLNQGQMHSACVRSSGTSLVVRVVDFPCRGHTRPSERISITRGKTVQFAPTDARRPFEHPRGRTSSSPSRTGENSNLAFPSPSAARNPSRSNGEGRVPPALASPPQQVGDPALVSSPCSTRAHTLRSIQRHASTIGAATSRHRHSQLARDGPSLP